MPRWVRVRDTQTGHTFDIDARTLPYRRGVEPVNDPDRWPDLEGPRAQPRPAKPFVGKDGKPRAAGRSSDATTDGGTVDTSSGKPSSRRTKISGPAESPADSSEETQR